MNKIKNNSFTIFLI